MKDEPVLVFSWDNSAAVDLCFCACQHVGETATACILWFWSMGSRAPEFPWTGVHQTLRHRADDRWSNGQTSAHGFITN